MIKVEIETLGEFAFSLHAESPQRARAVAHTVNSARIGGIADVFAAFNLTTIVCHPAADVESIMRRAIALAESTSPTADEISSPREAQIVRVCYAAEFALDLPALAARAGMRAEQFIDAHAAGEYEVLAIGFLPGFAYLGGLLPALHAPRRATPRTSVPTGSVAIGAGYTAVYPSASPGGWNILGRSPDRMFNRADTNPSRLRVGDRVRFLPISLAEFRRCG